MIAITSNSLNSNSTLPAIPGAIECPFLERETGADGLISIAPFPIRTPALLYKHLDAGAILFQHKSGLDLLASLGERLDSEIARMCSKAFRQYQRVLLITGTFSKSDKEVTLNGMRTGILYKQYQGALSKWNKRGGVIEHLPSDEDVLDWVALQESHLRELRDNPVKPVYTRSRMPHDDAMQDDPLQLCIPVQDGRNLLLSLPDCGPTTVEWLWRVSGGNTWLALQIATHSEWYKHLPDKPRSVGPAFVKKAQAYLGASEHSALLKDLLTMIGERSNGNKTANEK